MRVRVDARAGESIGEWHGDGVQLQTSSDRPRLRPHRTLHAPTSDEAHHSSLRRFTRSTNENTCVRYIRQQLCWSPVGVWSARRARGEGQRGAWPERPQAASLVVGRNRGVGNTAHGPPVRVECTAPSCSYRVVTVWGAARRRDAFDAYLFTFFSLGAHAPLARHHLTTAGRHSHRSAPASVFIPYSKLRGPSSCAAHDLRLGRSPRCCRARARRRTSMQTAAGRSHPPQDRTVATRR